MNIIFAKHDSCDKEFMFEVPEGMNPVKGDVLWVDTCQGQTVAIATSSMIYGHNIEQLIDKFGAYLPLKKVLSFANKGVQAYIRNTGYKDIINYCNTKQQNISGEETVSPYSWLFQTKTTLTQ